MSVEEAAKHVKGLHLFPDFLSEEEGTRVLFRLFDECQVLLAF